MHATFRDSLGARARFDDPRFAASLLRSHRCEAERIHGSPAFLGLRTGYTQSKLFRVSLRSSQDQNLDVPSRNHDK